MVDSTKLPEVDINAIATDLNNKMDRDGVNASCPTLLSRTANSNSGVTEIWSDGYCVQTGIITLTGKNKVINLTTAYRDMNYTVITNPNNNTDNWPISYSTDKTTSSFIIDGTGNYSQAAKTITISWRAEGYIR